MGLGTTEILIVLIMMVLPAALFVGLCFLLYKLFKKNRK
jgi:chromate transport protein ChrA